MKTKHLFFAAALPLAFAACTNEEFETMNGQPEIGGDQRPLVEVKLDFQKGDADTRVDYDGTKYSWEGTDTIGAFLMDEISSKNRPFGSTAEDWKGETWLEHYKLVDYIHTDYPFSWSTEEGKWVAPSKLQEGNYFFAAPYESYGGQRQMIHRIDGQTQTGGTIESMNAAIAKNQYFIGYAQIKAGTQNSEALGNVIMTPALAPVKVTLRNIGTLAKDVEKIIIRGDRVATALNVNPTNAQYNGTKADGSIDKNGSKYNLQQKISWIGKNYFNYANLNGAKEDEYTLNSREYVYNIVSGATDYSQADALRQTIHPSYSVANAKNAPEYERQAVLSFTSPVKVEANGGEIHFAVMVNTLEKIFIDRTDHSNSEKLTMDIITTQGQITNIDLTLAKEEEVGAAGGLDPNTVLLNKAITSLKSSVKNELIIQFDNNSVVKSSTKNIQDEDELLAFINWNAENTRLNTATLQRDVRFTKEMYDALHADGYKGRLAICTRDGAKLLVDDNVPTDVLNVLDLTSNATIVMNGNRELTKMVADKLNGAKLAIENRGTLAINEDVTTYVKLNNYGTINISEEGKLRGTSDNDKIYNYGVVNNKGEFYNLNNSYDRNEEAKGWVNTGKVNHFAYNAYNATIQLTTIDDKLTGSPYDGTIYFESASGILKVSKLNDQKVTKLNVTGGTIDFNDKDNNTVRELTIDGNVTLAGWNNYGLTTQVSAYHEFTGVNEASINGNVKFENTGITGYSEVVFEKGCNVTFAKNANVKESKSDFYDVKFINGAYVTVENAVTVTMRNITWNRNNISNLGTFRYYGYYTGEFKVESGNDINWFNPNAASEEEQQQQALAAAVKAMVVEYIDDTQAYVTAGYTVEKAGFEKYWNSATNFEARDKFKAQYGYMSFDEVWANVPTAVTSIDNDAASKTKLIATLKQETFTADANLYDTKDAATTTKSSAYKVFREGVVNTTITVAGLDKSVLRAANALTTAEIDEILEVTNPTMYVWEGCDLDKLVELWASYDGIFTGSIATQINDNEYSDAKVTHGATQNGKVTRLINWVKVMLNANSLSSAIVSEVQKELSNLGIKASNINSFSTYTNAQMHAVDNALAIQ